MEPHITITLRAVDSSVEVIDGKHSGAFQIETRTVDIPRAVATDGARLATFLAPALHNLAAALDGAPCTAIKRRARASGWRRSTWPK